MLPPARGQTFARMHERKTILWLVSWYPNKYNLFDGDFIQRHARAAAVHHDVHVLFIKQHEKQGQTDKVWSGGGGFTEQIVYLPKQTGVLGKLKNYREWQKQYKVEIGLITSKFHPAAVHVHIPWKVGLIALWARKRFGLPYLVTEHWGIYNDVVADNIYTKPFFFRRLLRRIYDQAAAFVSVSRYLGEGVNRTLVKKSFSVIPNVVDTNLFYPAADKHDFFTFIHVSNTVPLKNVEGIIKAFNDFLLQTKAGARLVIVGNTDQRYEELAKQLPLPKEAVLFRGEVPYPAVAGEVRRCHAFVLNSDIENSPCVIGEALCCGLPVIATAVGGVPELVTEENGLLVPPRHAAALAMAMAEMFQDYRRFNTARIALAAKDKFSAGTVARQFSDLYSGKARLID